MKVEMLLPKGTFEKTLYRLLEPIEVAGVHVPEGFVTDGASVPRVFWWVFPPTGRYFKAACVHDWLLSRGASYLYCNWKFREALEEQNVKPWVVHTMYSSVMVYLGTKRAYRWVVSKALSVFS